MADSSVPGRPGAGALGSGQAGGPWRQGRGSRSPPWAAPQLRDFPTAPVGFLAFSAPGREGSAREKIKMTPLSVTGEGERVQRTSNELGVPRA